VFANFAIEEVDATVIVQTDMKAIISAQDLTATPAENDRITDTAGIEWNVIKIMGVPGDSLWLVHVRRVGAVVVLPVESSTFILQNGDILVTQTGDTLVTQGI